jgi:hypothetical protein
MDKGFDLGYVLLVSNQMTVKNELINQKNDLD